MQPTSSSLTQSVTSSFTVISSAPAPAPTSSVSGAAGCVGLGYGIAVAVGVLILIATVALASYLCVLTKACAAHDAMFRTCGLARRGRSGAMGLDSASIDGLYPKYPHVRSGGPGDGHDPCAICLGEFTAGDALRRRPGCRHRFHACCAERWLRVSATCPVCRDSPSPVTEAVPLAAHAR